MTLVSSDVGANQPPPLAGHDLFAESSAATAVSRTARCPIRPIWTRFSSVIGR